LAMPAAVLRQKLEVMTLADSADWLRRTYSSPIAYGIKYIANFGQREWLRVYIESRTYFVPS